jgi:hypothetical protein
VPYRNRSNVGPTIAHPAPAAILIRHQIRLDIWGIGTVTDEFCRLPEAGLGYSRLPPFHVETGRIPRRKPTPETGATLFSAAESVAGEVLS